MTVSDNNYVAARPGTALAFPASMFKPTQLFIASIPPAGFATLPGPPVNFVRWFDSIFIQSATLAGVLTAAVVVDLLPSNIRIGAVTAPGTSTGAFRGGSPLAFGESMRVTNGSANTANVCATYFDIPSERITVFRQDITNVASTIIPAAPAGSQRRFLQIATFLLGGTGRTVVAALIGRNADTITHNLEFLYNGIVFQRGPGIATVSPFSPNQFALNIPVTTIPVQARLAEAVAVTPLQLFGAYETLPL